MKILFVYSDDASEWNCSEHRCYVPYRALRRAGVPVEIMFVTDFTKRTPEAESIAEEADLIVVQRNLFMETIAQVAYWRARGKVVIGDLDDAYQYMTADTGSRSWRFWKDGIQIIKDANGKDQEFHIEPTPFAQLEWGMKLAGNLSSPSKLILDDWADKVPNRLFMPNYLESRIYRRYNVYKEPGKIYIGWGGSMGHLMGWRDSGVAMALKNLVIKYKNIQIAFFGDDRAANIKDDRSARLLDFSEARKAILGWTPYMTYSEKLSVLDIGLVPLHGDYDRRRSCLKSLEYTIMGIPWIGSDLEPNRELKTGRLIQSPDWRMWFEAISEYIETLTERTYEARDNIVVGRLWDVDRNVEKIMEGYRWIYERNH